MPPQGGRKHPHQEFIQIDTTNVLFILGGAFAGLEQIIEQRIGHKGVGFHGTVRSRRSTRDPGELFAQVLPEDLVKFGMIPEFIGRLPMVGAVRSLDQRGARPDPHRAEERLVKQYQKVFEFEDVELEFTHDGLEAIADQALLRGTGARGLRAILEEVLLNTMYDLPGRTDIGKVVIDADDGEREGQPDARAPRAARASARPRPERRRPPSRDLEPTRRWTSPTRSRTSTSTPSYDKTGRIDVAVDSTASARCCSAMGDPQLAAPGHPRHRHERQGFDGADDHPAARWPTG